MRYGILLAVAALLGQASSPYPNGLKPVALSASGQKLRLWLPGAYEEDKLVSHKFARVPTTATPDVVTLRVGAATTKRPEPPPLPVEADLLMAEPTLGNLKFTGAVETWRGRPISTVRYEGFLQGRIGVYGRMAWLPLEPGTVMIHLYAEPSWAGTMNQDWEVILANIEGPMSELTLRERAPNRWLAAKIVAGIGILVALVGIIMILARMNEAVGGAVVYLGLLLPIVPIGYGVLHLQECKRGLLVFLGGAAVFGLSLFLER
jgi:hypothetical protein